MIAVAAYLGMLEAWPQPYRDIWAAGMVACAGVTLGATVFALAMIARPR